MHILTESHNGLTLVQVVGSLDALSAGEFNTAMDALIDSGAERIILDFAQTDYVASAGVRAILRLVKALRAANGDLRAASVDQDLVKVFEMTGLKGIIKFYPDVEAASQGF